ncbi:hypothetical protein HanPI659440_Chr10g0395791 [Helianthus annuus]|nr:hypothetical protein HanPI659440_Chr10g0395791 [Helianthus annuus]
MSLLSKVGELASRPLRWGLTTTRDYSDRESGLNLEVLFGKYRFFLPESSWNHRFLAGRLGPTRPTSDLLTD